MSEPNTPAPEAVVTDAVAVEAPASAEPVPVKSARKPRGNSAPESTAPEAAPVPPGEPAPVAAAEEEESEADAPAPPEIRVQKVRLPNGKIKTIKVQVLAYADKV